MSGFGLNAMFDDAGLQQVIDLRPSPSLRTVLSCKRIEGRSNRSAIPAWLRRRSARLNSPYSMWVLTSSASPGGHPHISPGEGFCASQAWFNYRCSICSQKQRLLGPMKEEAHHTHALISISCSFRSEPMSKMQKSNRPGGRVGTRPDIRTSYQQVLFLAHGSLFNP